jgi:hypothetical protein
MSLSASYCLNVYTSLGFDKSAVFGQDELARRVFDDWLDTEASSWSLRRT